LQGALRRLIDKKESVSTSPEEAAKFLMLLQSDISGNQQYRGKRGALLKRPRHADVRRKRTIVHKADSEVNDLADLKRFNDDNIGESHRIISTIFTADDAESLIRIETLYDSLHMAPAFLR
jgi:hypothetical protein